MCRPARRSGPGRLTSDRHQIRLALHGRTRDTAAGTSEVTLPSSVPTTTRFLCGQLPGLRCSQGEPWPGLQKARAATREGSPINGNHFLPQTGVCSAAHLAWLVDKTKHRLWRHARQSKDERAREGHPPTSTEEGSAFHRYRL